MRISRQQEPRPTRGNLCLLLETEPRQVYFLQPAGGLGRWKKPNQTFHGTAQLEEHNYQVEKNIGHGLGSSKLHLVVCSRQGFLAMTTKRISLWFRNHQSESKGLDTYVWHRSLEMWKSPGENEKFWIRFFEESKLKKDEILMGWFHLHEEGRAKLEMKVEVLAEETLSK